MEKKEETLTAAQRLARLEDSVYTLDQAIGGLSQVLDVVRHATRLLGRKLDAVVTLSEQNIAITNDSINFQMEEQTIQEMKDMIAEFKTKGTLVDSETITPETLVVCRESNADTGKVTKQRLQFPFQDVADEMKPILLGKTVGDILRFDSKPFDVEILEIYKIVQDAAPTSDNPDATLN